LVGFGSGLGQPVIDTDRLHRIALAKLPVQVVASDKLPESRMKRSNVIVLEIHLDERLPVVVALVDLHPIQHVAVLVQRRGNPDALEITSNVALPIEKQSVPMA